MHRPIAATVARVARRVIGSRVMHLDGTGLPVLDGTVEGGKRLGALWGYVGVNANETVAAYLFLSTGKKVGQRAHEMGPEDMLGLRKGLTVADAARHCATSRINEPPSGASSSTATFRSTTVSSSGCTFVLH